MRQLSPAFIVTSLALSLASGSVLAQVSRTGNTAPSTATTTANNPANSTTSTATAPSASTPGVLVPGIAAVTGIVDSGVNGERTTVINVPAPTASANAAVTPTPLFELAARQGMANEQRRRARGEEPRVYGIAPRTDRDLTNQMPDDPIIRY